MLYADRMILYTCLLLILSVGLGACGPLAKPVVLPTSSSTPALPTTIPTPTIVWFPATPTYTPLPIITRSVTPTLDLSPHYGALIHTDTFAEAGDWETGRRAGGSIALGKNELTLAASQPRLYLFSMFQGMVLGDFYLEITASPSLCRAGDEYGLLLRASDAQDFYRFGLLCSGQARLDRSTSEAVTSPRPPAFSGAVPRGAPSTSRLAVWALGKEMRFYANGAYLFSVSDPTTLSGGIGLFVRAVGDTPITVNFSDLAIYEALP